jgi:hypothetical protein
VLSSKKETAFLTDKNTKEIFFVAFIAVFSVLESGRLLAELKIKINSKIFFLSISDESSETLSDIY